MAKFLAGVLSVIAVGVLLIAYGLLNPRAAAFEPRAEMSPFARPMLAGEQVTLADEYAARYGYYRPETLGYTSPGYGSQPFSQVTQPRAVRTSQVVSAPRRVTTRTVERAPGRDWKKTALIIGGTTAAGAGLGGIFAGKKGALIGAAIGGGASTVYEATKK